MSSGLYHIDKLDDSNYEGWRIQMKSVLIHSELWSYVSGAKPRPDDGAAADVLDAWIVKDEKALATIVLSVRTSQLLHVKNCTTSLSAWQKIEEVHRPKGPARKVTIFKSMINLKMSEGSAMNAHLNSFFELADKLSEMDIKLPDELLTIMLLSSLPSSYENFVVAIESRDDLPKSSILKTKLMEEYSRRDGGSEGVLAAHEGESAFYVKNQRNNTKNKTNNNNQQARPKLRGKCYKCHKTGHYASSCQNRSEAGEASSFAMLNTAGSKSVRLHNSVWVFDSGSTCHMCCVKEMFVNMKAHREKIQLAAHNYMFSEGIGDVVIETSSQTITLRDVLYVPALTANFLSISKAAKSGHLISFNSESAVISKKSGSIVLSAELCDSLYIYQHNNFKLYVMKSAEQENVTENHLKWHERYGHLNIRSLKSLEKNKLVRGIDVNNFPKTLNCEVCLKGKMCVLPFAKNNAIRSSAILEIVHSDICGPMRTTSMGGYKYFALFIDDFSRMTFVYFLKNKSDILSEFKKFKSQVELQTNAKIKVLRTDNGREYISAEFNRFLESEGVRRQLTVAYTPQQNGVAERANRTLVEMARCMLLSSRLPEYLWGEAINTAVYLRNRSPTNLLLCTPYEAWSGRKPSVNHLRVFGCKAVVLDKRQGKSKFAPRGIECFMVGYSSESKAYRVYNPSKRVILKSRDIKFIENFNQHMSNENDYTIIEASTAGQPHTNISPIKSDPENTVNRSVIFDDVVEMDAVNDDVVYISDDDDDTVVDEDDIFDDAAEDDVFVEADDVSAVGGADESVGAFGADVDVGGADESDDKVGAVGANVEGAVAEHNRADVVEKSWNLRPRKDRTNSLYAIGKCNTNPETIDEALGSHDSARWRKSMNEEFQSLIKNRTWDLVDLPVGRRPIKSKWVFCIKRDQHGNIDKYKSRLVAKGCSQKFGIDYNETFSPVVRYSSLRLILACAVEYGLYVHQMDVTTAYLNGNLSEDIYMAQPELFVDVKNPNKVCKLNKTIYGLKQAGREWNAKLDSVLKSIGFKQCNSDSCVYTMNIKQQRNIIAVYVDDILLAISSEQLLNKIKQQISSEFAVVDKGPVSYYLGMEIRCERNTISVSHKQFICELLKEHGMAETRSCSTPLDPGQRFKRCTDCSGCSFVDTKRYQSLIGSLMYLGISTRPDIAHSVSKLAQFNTNPHAEHLAAAKHILRYLFSTMNTKILFKRTGQNLVAYADADWAGSCDERKSYTGYTFVLAGASITWESRKQQTVALSSTEAEYMALCAASKETVYLRNFLKELGFENFVKGPTILYGDNISSQHLVKNPMYHAKTKHIDIKMHYVREVYNKNLIEIKYVPTDKNIADIFTKNLNKKKHMSLSNQLGLL